jgi:hypothetical protein
MLWGGLALALLAVLPARLPGADCGCDHTAAATLEAPECSLCREAEKHTSHATPIFFVKDASPRKPNRTLALPVLHGKGVQDLEHVSPEQRLALWKAAMAKAEELWPGQWGLAVNSPTVRTQCHLHIHIGKLNEGADETTGGLVASAEEIPVPPAGRGIWLHPVPGGLHVHLDREISEPVLMR